MRKKILYRAEFFTEGGTYPLVKYLDSMQIEYKIQQDAKSKTWTLEWKQ